MAWDIHGRSGDGVSEAEARVSWARYRELDQRSYQGQDVRCPLLVFPGWAVTSSSPVISRSSRLRCEKSDGLGRIR